MNPNLRSLTKEKREVQMMRRLMPATLAAMTKVAFTLLCCALLMLFAAPAWADQCSTPTLGPGAGSVGSDTAGLCGALITVFQVSDGTATAFTVSSPGNGNNNNPYDGTEDTLLGIQNNSGAPLFSIHLSSSDTTFGGIFNFDGDGPCPQFNTTDCFNGNPPSLGFSGYEGPHNTFTVDPPSSCGENCTFLASGTVNFFNFVSNVNIGIPAGGSTWFALEGTATSFGSISQTQILQPGVTAIYPAGNDNSKWTGLNNIGGEQLTVTAIPILQTDFDTNIRPFDGFPNESCVPYKDFTDANNGVHTCLGFQTSCVGSDCATLLYDLKTNYDLPSDLAAIGGVDFLVFHGQPCPPNPSITAKSIFLDFSVNRFDPVHHGGGGGTSCYYATYTPGAPLITSGTFSAFSGFELFVSDSKINPIFQGLPEILVWDLHTNLGVPVAHLSLCKAVNPPPDGSCADIPSVSPPWVNLGLIPIPSAATSNCPSGFPPTGPLPSLFNLGLKKGDEVGEYVFVWDTKTKKKLKGCQVSVLLQFDLGSGLTVVTPAKFQYQF